MRQSSCCSASAPVWHSLDSVVSSPELPPSDSPPPPPPPPSSVMRTKPIRRTTQPPAPTATHPLHRRPPIPPPSPPSPPRPPPAPRRSETWDVSSRALRRNRTWASGLGQRTRAVPHL